MRTSPVRRVRRPSLSVEALEDRTVPAGNVTAFVAGGVLQVIGDAADNVVWVEALGDGRAVVTGLAGTTVNGSAAPVVLGGIEFAYQVRLGRGNDALWLTGAQGDRAVWIDSGPGNDRVAILACWNTGPNIIQTGSGDDLVSIASVIWKQNVTFVDLGSGNDSLAVGGVEFGSGLFRGGSGTNVAVFDGASFRTQPFAAEFPIFSPSVSVVANPDRASVAPGGSVTIPVLANDATNRAALDPGSVTIVVPPAQGTVRVNPDGTITYTAGASASGTITFQYAVRNLLGEESNPAPVAVEVSSSSGPAVPTGPVPTITSPASSPTTINPIPFTITFDRDVTGFTAGDIVLTNGTLTAFQVLTARQYTLSVSPGNDGPVGVTIPAGAAQDAAGRPSVAAGFSVVADTPPRMTLRANSSTASDGPFVVTATANQDITGFTITDVQVTNATVSAFTPVTSRIYQFTVTPDGSGNRIDVSIAAGAFTDTTSNGNFATELSIIAERDDSGMAPTTSPPDPNDSNWVTQANGLKTWLVQPGDGPAATSNSTLGVFYTGWLLDGTVFDSSRTAGAPAVFALANLIEGWKQGVPGLQPGGILRLYIPAALGYGAAGSGAVPPNADLLFEIKLVWVA